MTLARAPFVDNLSSIVLFIVSLCTKFEVPSIALIETGKLFQKLKTVT